MLIACKEHSSVVLFADDDESAQKNYQDVLQRENKKGTRKDTLLYGISFRMPDTAFFTYCTKMFKKGVFNGGYDYEVTTHMTNDFKRPVQLKFYPVFANSQINAIPCQFSYINASIYKKEDRADVLLSELLPLMMKWYGGNIFIQMPTHDPLKGPKYIKVDSNRQITVAEGDDITDVEVDFKDLKAGGEKIR